MFVRVKPSGPRKYLQIVENYREEGKVKQQVIANLGRLDILQQTGQLDAIISGLARYSEHLAVIDATKRGQSPVTWDKEWGPALVFERLWNLLGLVEIIASLKRSHRYEFDVERATFAVVLQRLICPGSDLEGSKWIEDTLASGFDGLQLQHLYRSMDFLAEHKEQIECQLFDRSRNLFDVQVDLVFFDTTTIYFEGNGPSELAEYGYSKDHRPDRKQLLVGVVMSRSGFPLCCQFWPGNTSDIKTVEKVIETVKQKFSLRRVIFVADRGMVSQQNIAYLESSHWDYILGVRLRRLKRVREQVLQDSSPFQEIEHNLQVKEVWCGEERFVVCFNPQEAARDRQAREQMLAQLSEQLQRGATGLLANHGYARFLTVKSDSIAVDPEKVEADAQFDGKFVLTTNTELSAAEVARSYKGLWQVERGFRNLKDVLAIRPVYHRHPSRVTGHVFASFLSLVLMTALEKKLEEKGIETSWDDLIRDLRAFRAIKVHFSNKDYRLRTECRGAVYHIFQAVGLHLPTVVELVQ